MKVKTRQNKSISFKLTDKYEANLLAHAESDTNGDFSKYIKRLISKDVDGRTQTQLITNVEKSVAITRDVSDFNGYI